MIIKELLDYLKNNNYAPNYKLLDIDPNDLIDKVAVSSHTTNGPQAHVEGAMCMLNCKKIRLQNST